MPMYGLSHKDFQIKILYALLISLMLENKTNFYSNIFHSMSNNINIWNSLTCSVFHALIRCIKCVKEQLHTIFITFIAIWSATCFSHILFYYSTVNVNQKLYVSLILCSDSDIFLLQTYACSQINHPEVENCDLLSYFAASSGDSLS